MGNPTSYLGSTLSWSGKQLISYSQGSTSVSYSYNEDGLRLRKTVNGTDTEYYYNGSALMYMITGSGSTAVKQRFSYDAAGNVAAVVYKNGSSTAYTYYYIRNAQGDIVKLIDSSGNTVVEYLYDSWGKLLSVTGTLATTLGADQPFRYRGYVYDTETGWYYLQSRYYDPNTCRFISADVLLSTGQGVIGHNALAYCGNNPIIRIDSEGTLFFTVFGAIVGAVTGAISAAINHEDIVAGAVGGAVTGAINGAFTDATFASVGMLAPAAIAVGGFASGVGETTKQFISNIRSGQSAEEAWHGIAWGDVYCSAIVGGIFGGLSYGAGDMIKHSLESTAVELYKEAIQSGIVRDEASMLVKSLTQRVFCTLASNTIYDLGSVICSNTINTGRKLIRNIHKNNSITPRINIGRNRLYANYCY